MAIDVGHILDKYELLEEVGQGGMAVVYRGLDRSLQREVAVKVLHRHLASHKEARERFEREAHAVAKLHHENILEIFDFSGNSSSESYIVTEFIQGPTLRQFINDHQIGYPEIGALITAQVCKALTHAHGMGILHRDVKPENIMIGAGGVVKLMDFGIAQMVDLQRMTVTGQLLGSLAYMSPEHVRGNPLDFRTDVFSVGILLYQLVTGELPFRGRNPHEILKRIAECQYKPAHQVNPMVGRELTQIIGRALAREPDDRYPDISEMSSALSDYLEDCGLGDHPRELGQYFAAPASYELALKARLIDALTRRGLALVDENRSLALEKFNRVLTIDPDHPEVLRIVDRMGRRARSRQLALALGGIVAIGVAAIAVEHVMRQPDEPRGLVVPSAVLPAAGTSDAAVAAAAPSPADAGVAAAAMPPDAAAPASRATRPPHDSHPHRVITHRDRPDAGPPLAPAKRRIALTVFPQSSDYRVGGGPWKTIPGRRVSFEASGDATVEVRNPRCCETEKVRVADAVGDQLSVTLGFLPARLTLQCDVAHTLAQVDGDGVPLGRAIEIPLSDSAFGERTVEVAFFTEDGDKLDKRRIKLRFRDTRIVKCEF